MSALIRNVGSEFVRTDVYRWGKKKIILLKTLLWDLPTQTENAIGTSGQAEQTQFLNGIRGCVYGPLGLVDHVNLVPRGGTVRPQAEHNWQKRKNSSFSRSRDPSVSHICDTKEAIRAPSRCERFETRLHRWSVACALHLSKMLYRKTNNYYFQTLALFTSRFCRRKTTWTRVTIYMYAVKF